MLSNEELTVKIQEVLASSEIVKCLSVNDVNHKPHPYTVGTRHVSFAAEKHGGMLGVDAIIAAEKSGVRCAHPGCIVPYNKHTYDIVCFLQLKKNTTNELLSKELEPVHTMEECEGLDGFAFVDTDEKFRVE